MVVNCRPLTARRTTTARGVANAKAPPLRATTSALSLFLSLSLSLALASSPLSPPMLQESHWIYKGLTEDFHQCIRRLHCSRCKIEPVMFPAFTRVESPAEGCRKAIQSSCLRELQIAIIETCHVSRNIKALPSRLFHVYESGARSQIRYPLRIITR